MADTRDIVHSTVAQRLGARAAFGTATSVTTTTLASTDILYTQNDHLNGAKLRIRNGAAAGTIREITDYSYSGGTGTITFPTISALAGTPTFEIYWPNKFDPTECNNYIGQVVDQLAERHLTDEVMEAYRVDDVLEGAGDFEYWHDTDEDGDEDTPGDMTGGYLWVATNATMTKETTIVSKHAPMNPLITASLKLVNTASANGYATYSFPDYRLLAGKTVTVKGSIRSPEASRARVKVTDGITTTNCDLATDTDDFESFSKEITIGSNPRKFEIVCDISSGGAITVYFDDIRVLDTTKQFYTCPPQFSYLKDIWIESATANIYNQRKLASNEWKVIKASELWAFTNEFRPAMDTTGSTSTFSDRRITLMGHGKPTIPIEDSDVIEFATADVVALVAEMMIMSHESSWPDSGSWRVLMNAAIQQANFARASLASPPDPGARPILSR